MKSVELDFDETIVIPRKQLEELLKQCSEFNDLHRHTTVRDMKAVVPFLKEFESSADAFDIAIWNAIID